MFFTLVSLFTSTAKFSQPQAEFRTDYFQVRRRPGSASGWSRRSKSTELYTKELEIRLGPRNVQAPSNTALGSDGQGPKGFSFVFSSFLDFLFAISDLFTDLARAFWASWSVRRGRARSCGYVWIAQSHTERPR